MVMAGKRSERARDKEINRKFEKQGRRLNRQWMRNAMGGIILIVVVIIVLQFTPYRNLHLDIIDAAKRFVKSLTSGNVAPTEPDPKYW